jgi:hypothetical protein
LQGLQGLQGDTGLTGAQGPAGATGATGPSEVQVLTVPSFSLQTTTPNTSALSTYFGNLIVGGKYKFEIVVRGKTNSALSRIGLEIYSSGTGNTLNYNYVLSNVDDFKNGSSWIGTQFLVVGTIAVGSASSSLAINLIDGMASTRSDPMTVSGTALITLVGSITG